MSLRIFAVIGTILLFEPSSCRNREPSFSVCDEAFYGNCYAGLSTDEMSPPDLKPISASVRGLWLLYNHGWQYEPTALAQFIFQEKVDEYILLDDEIKGNITLIKAMGDSWDYRTPVLTLINELDLLSHGASRLSESHGSINHCIGRDQYTTKSFVLNGAERWELFSKNGTSICVQVEDTFSFVPAIVRDIRTLGFDFEEDNGKICYVVRGCSKSFSEIVKLPNNETVGILRR